jgi:GNAT superfamily N-acetyltransferase
MPSRNYAPKYLKDAGCELRLRFNDIETIIGLIYVPETHRQMGFGGILMNYAHLEAIKRNHKTIWLMIGDYRNDFDIVDWYRRLGFIRDFDDLDIMRKRI